MLMNTERYLYIDSIYELLNIGEPNRVTEILKSWTENSKGRNMASAACHYLTHVVLPSLFGSNLSPLHDSMPDWVKEQLFMGDLEKPTTVNEWLGLFPGSAIVGFNEKGTGGIQKLTADLLTEECIAGAKENSWGIFFTPNRVSGINHLDDEVVEFRYFFLDFDGGDKEDQMRRIENLPFAASFIVESRNGYHAYYRLRKNNIDQKVWRGIEKRLIGHSGADEKACNPARVLRIPFTWHCKEEPYFITIKKWTENVYDWQEFERVFPEPRRVEFKKDPNKVYLPSVKVAPAGILTKDGRHGGLEDYLKAAYFRIKEDQTLASDLRRYTKEWYEHGHTPQKPNWEQEVDNMCDWFERKQWGCTVSN